MLLKFTTCAENMGRALQNLVGWTELQSMYKGVWGEGLPRKRKRVSMGGGEGIPRKRKYLANSYTAARVNANYK